jgi:hypothetical protein
MSHYDTRLTHTSIAPAISNTTMIGERVPALAPMVQTVPLAFYNELLRQWFALKQDNITLHQQVAMLERQRVDGRKP